MVQILVCLTALLVKQCSCDGRSWENIFPEDITTRNEEASVLLERGSVTNGESKISNFIKDKLASLKTRQNLRSYTHPKNMEAKTENNHSLNIGSKSANSYVTKTTETPSEYLLKGAKTTQANLRSFPTFDTSLASPEVPQPTMDIDELLEAGDVLEEIDNNLDLVVRRDKSLIGTFPFNQHGTHEHNDNHHADHHDHNHSEGHRDHEDHGHSQKHINHQHHGHHGEGSGSFEFDSINKLNRLSPSEIDFSQATEEKDGRICIQKVMMTEETKYDEVLTCDHSYDNRCHTSYVTKYEPHQEEECEEKFKKECYIEYEKKAYSETVNVCKASLVKDCDVEGEEECRTFHQSECWTQQKVHQVEDDIATCNTINEEKCEEVTVGYTTQKKCDTWPREVCNLEKKQVKKYTPETVCEKVPQKMCAPKGCGISEGPVVCVDKVKTILVDNPVEDCNLEPIRTCKHVTKLVPSLVASQDCIDVPKEICTRSKINPTKIKKPSIQKWCYRPSNNITIPSSPGCEADSDCPTNEYCYNESCEECATNNHCHDGYWCRAGKCKARSGKVLLESITIKTDTCTDCTGQEGVEVKLLGEKIAGFSDGVPCDTSVLDHPGQQDFVTGRVATFDGEVEQMLGTCYESPLNGILMDGGTLTWRGEGSYNPESLCVNWKSEDNLALKCNFEEVVPGSQWKMVGCTDVGSIKCSEGKF